MEAGDENILDLKKAARMEERKRVAKAFERAGAHVKTKIRGSVFENFFEVGGIQAGREFDIGQILDGDKTLFEANRFPNLLPETNSASTIAQKLRSRIQ